MTNLQTKLRASISGSVDYEPYQNHAYDIAIAQHAYNEYRTKIGEIYQPFVPVGMGLKAALLSATARGEDRAE